MKVPERRDSVQGLSPTSQRAFGLKEPAFGEDTRPSTAASQEPLPPLGDKRRPTSTGSRRSEEWDKSLGTGSAEMGNVTGRDVSKFVFAQHQADAAASVKFRPPGEGEMTDPATRRRMTVAESDVEDASDTMKYIGGGNAGAEVATAASPKAKKTGIDMGTQSDYRESETQTDFIWDPDIAPIDPDKPQPDVLFF